MSNRSNAADNGVGSGKAYSASITVGMPSRTTCSFCWFVLKLYPTLKEMTDRDTLTFRKHLEQVHGLKEEIEP